MWKSITSTRRPRLLDKIAEAVSGFRAAPRKSNAGSDMTDANKGEFIVAGAKLPAARRASQWWRRRAALIQEYPGTPPERSVQPRSSGFPTTGFRKAWFQFWCATAGR